MIHRDYSYEDIGPEYFARLLGSDSEPAEIVLCEKGGLHDEHKANPEMARWRLV